jgi:ATP-dependent Lhr-like helicase
MPLEGFQPAVRDWFARKLGRPTEPQRRGWPSIQAGRNVLIAAPTGSGKTLAAFLSAIDSLFAAGPYLPDETRVLYVSPLKALSNDIQKNLQGPLAEIREASPFLPEVRVLVRTGDTTPRERASMRRRPPHILVTTPESLYILLTSDGGRAMLRSVRAVIVDEIHALARDKRGSHLALSMERLEALAGRPVQRIGLSATQKPIDEIARFLAGAGRDVEIVDAGHLRNLDLAVELPRSPLAAVCSHETWDEIYDRMAELIGGHRTTLVFVNTRKLAERIAARLTDKLGADVVSCHHGSLSRERRLDAEQRLKAGRLRALVATASLELGIDIGDVDLAVQVGSARSIATFLQRVGRAGHGVDRVPKGRLFPLTLDELAEAEALLRAVARGELDRIHPPSAPLDILAQQVVAACVAEPWPEEALFGAVRRAWPYRDLAREDFDRVVRLHAEGRAALLHRDGVNARLRATRRARLAAVTCGGAIPDAADYDVVLHPDGARVGSVNEDFAIESNVGDIFQLGNVSWRIRKVERGAVFVEDARGQPPTLPFWLGEAPGRTPELSAEVGAVREEGGRDSQLRAYLAEGRRALGAVPTPRRVILERFFDEAGGMQLVLHAPFGSRINRAWGLALRKRFCRGFGFELQAAANEEAILLSLGPQHSFALDEVFDYLHPNTVRDVLVQALLAAPMFQTRWRWNVARALRVERMRGGKRVPAGLLRMRADDELAAAFPQAAACFETLPPGDIEVPMEHPLVRQTVEDCLREAMDIDGLVEILKALRDGRIERRAVDTPEPSVFAHGILAAQPYTFLDDAPLEERRTQAVLTRRALDPKTADELGALDPDAIRLVREQAWPRPETAEEVHEALLWMGYATVDEARSWQPWINDLRAAGRVELDGGRWFAVEAPRDPVSVLRGRLEALGPIVSDDPAMLDLEREGVAMRCRFEGREGWCHRRLLARIHRATVERLRREIEPASATEFLRFLAAWQSVEPASRLEGPRGVAEALRQLAGFEVPAADWEASVLRARVRDYRPEWLDQLTLSGEFAWGRLWGAGAAPIRSTPICVVPREDLEAWMGLTAPPDPAGLSGYARDIHAALQSRGAMFPAEIERETRLLPSHLEMGLAELVARGLLTGDSFASLRQLIVPPSRRARRAAFVGRLTLFRRPPAAPRTDPEFLAMALLRRTGVVFKPTLAREKAPVPWRELVRVYRRLELRGEVRGGRFVAGFSGEQFALPGAVERLRAARRAAAGGELEAALTVSAADPLNFRGILTPDERVSPLERRRVPL